MQAQSDFAFYADQLGIKTSALGEWVFLSGRKVRIIGINPRARAMPIMTEEMSGKRYKMRTRALPQNLMV